MSPYRIPSAPRTVSRFDRILAAVFPEILIVWIVGVVRLLHAGRFDEGALVALVVAILGLPLLVASAVEAVAVHAS